ncbi:MAG: metallophosphoesterase [Caulobacteraceae bacterium]
MIPNIKEFLYTVFGYVYIPDELLGSKEKILLHISDTPVCFYPELRRLIKKLNPQYIIHTGDMVDNIKLELFPNSTPIYEKYVKKLLQIMEDTSAETILALGNHDDLEIVKKHSKKSRIIEKSETVEIEKLSFKISHYSEEIIKSPAEYNLYGHDLFVKSGCSDGRMYFNGISSINIIGLDSGTHFCLFYSAETDAARMGRGKIGL